RRIAELAKRLQNVKGVVLVEGHTDALGSAAYNLRLSRLRANAVKEELSKAVPGLQIKAVGYGETRPIAPNKTKDGKDNPAGRERPAHERNREAAHHRDPSTAQASCRCARAWSVASHSGAPFRRRGVPVDNGKECAMEPRLDLLSTRAGGDLFTMLVSANNALAASPLPRATQELVKIRASQINGCGFCVDMHTKEAAHAGESPVRLNLIAAWREATVFTGAERAALELVEQGTRLADAAGGVTDEAWADAAEHY